MTAVSTIPEGGVDHRALFAALPHAYVVVSPDLVIMAANDAYRTATMKQDEIVGSPLFDVFPDDARAPRSAAAAVRASIAIALESGHRHDLWRQKLDVPQAVGRDGGYAERYWNISSHPVRAPTGAVSCIVQTLEDVTEAVRQDQADQERIRAPHGHLAAPFEQQAVGVMHIAFDGRIVDVNGRLCDLLGYSADELRARTINEITDPDDIPASMRLADALVAGKLPHYTIEKRYIRKDGSQLWVSTSRSLVRTADGKPDYFVAVVEDISARKAAETALREREAYLRSILDTVPDGMIVIDAAGCIQSFSRAAETLFGYAADEVVGGNVKLLMPPGDRERHDSYIRGYLDTNIPRIIGIGRVVTGCRKDGSNFALHLSVGEIALDEKRLFVGFLRDLTERQEAEARLQELQSELVHISRFTALGEMASALAHELNQPLTASTNYLKGARRILDQGIDGRLPLLNEAVEQAAAQALRAGQIIRRLRDFVARGESERRMEDLKALIEEASALALVGAAERGVRVFFDFDPSVPTVYADRIQIQQVLLNLIRNAIEAMHDSERRELTVTTSAKPDGMVEVGVRDTGLGLAPDVASNLFQPFITTKPTGMGVGLSICRTIVEAHEGRITAVANPGGGTIFRFTLRALGQENGLDA